MQQPQFPLEQTSGILCEECNHPFFKASVILRKVSRFLTGTDKDAIIPIQVFACAKCNHVNKEFLPEPVKDLYNEPISSC